MTISFKIAFWIGCENIGINYLVGKCQSRRNQKDKGKVTQAKKFGQKSPTVVAEKDLGDSSDNESKGPVTIGKFVKKMYKTNELYFDVQTQLYKTLQIRTLAEIQQQILQVVKLTNIEGNQRSIHHAENSIEASMEDENLAKKETPKFKESDTIREKRRKTLEI